MIYDTGNFNYLTEELNIDEVDNSEEGLEAFKFIANKRINKYGVGKTYMKILKKERQYLITMNDGLAKSDDHIQQKAEWIKREIDKLSNEESQGKREDTLIKIGKFVYGKPISAMEITLADFDSNSDYADRLLEAQEAARIKSEAKSKK